MSLLWVSNNNITVYIIVYNVAMSKLCSITCQNASNAMNIFLQGDISKENHMYDKGFVNPAMDDVSLPTKKQPSTQM